MWLLLSLLFVIGFFHTACNVSLLPRRRYQLIYSAGIFAGISALFPSSQKLNIKDVDQFLSEFETLSTACTFQVAEALFIMIVSLLLIRSHYQRSAIAWRRRVAQLLALAPSGIFLVGMFILQTYLFNTIEETPFYLIALMLAVAGFSIMLFTSYFMGKLLSSWGMRIEVKIILAFLQILLAMFLPIIISGNKLEESHFVFEFWQSATTIIILFLITIIGLLWYRKRPLRFRF